LVAPEAEGEDLEARREAILKPRILKEFFERYRRAKFPNDTIAGNVLKSLGLPPDRIDSALEVVKTNGRYAGIIRDTPTGPFVSADSPGVPAPAATPGTPEHEDHDDIIAPLSSPKRLRSALLRTPQLQGPPRPPGASTREPTRCSYLTASSVESSPS
jgi:hypothetical protein